MLKADNVEKLQKNKFSLVKIKNSFAHFGEEKNKY